MQHLWHQDRFELSWAPKSSQPPGSSQPKFGTRKAKAVCVILTTPPIECWLVDEMMGPTPLTKNLQAVEMGASSTEASQQEASLTIFTRKLGWQTFTVNNPIHAVVVHGMWCGASKDFYRQINTRWVMWSVSVAFSFPKFFHGSHIGLGQPGSSGNFFLKCGIG